MRTSVYEMVTVSVADTVVSTLPAPLNVKLLPFEIVWEVVPSVIVKEVKGVEGIHAE